MHLGDVHLHYETVLKFIDEEMNTIVKVRANRPNYQLDTINT